ncbi:MAG: hypothetical protein K6U89_16355 [Chloroflexi bacterium]|nr:hypothetical protein [Chloroflexota bacterium]
MSERQASLAGLLTATGGVLLGALLCGGLGVLLPELLTGGRGGGLAVGLWASPVFLCGGGVVGGVLGVVVGLALLSRR